MRSSVIGMVILLGSSTAAAAEPLVVDPWLERVPPPTLWVFEPLSEIIDPWAGTAVVALYETDEIVDPWASYHSKIPTVAFPPIE